MGRGFRRPSRQGRCERPAYTGHLRVGILGLRPPRGPSHIGRHPATGSPRYALDLNLPGLRFWPLKRYPYLVFYVARSDPIDVWRALHGQRDIPAWMQDQEAL
jgi:hypothetical protein